MQADKHREATIFLQKNIKSDVLRLCWLQCPIDHATMLCPSFK